MAKYLKSNQLIYLDSNDHEYSTIIDREPDVCPLCGKGIKPIFIVAHGIPGRYPDPTICECVYKCPREKCQSLFIAVYSSTGGRSDNGEFVFYKGSYFPKSSEKQKFEEEIENLSSRFVKVFNQAKVAEENNLDEVSGPGYRKALEILIKDYLIHIYPDQEDKIKKKFLGDLISEKIKNKTIKEIAKRAAWLGNDETHYIRVWEKLDLEDLKKLIKLVTYWISQSLLSNDYISEIMPEKNKSGGE